MVAHLLDLAIMRSTDNFARENVLVKATSKLEHQGVQPTRQAVPRKSSEDPELSAALDAINKRNARRHSKRLFAIGSRSCCPGRARVGSRRPIPTSPAPFRELVHTCPLSRFLVDPEEAFVSH
jgi:hypothetical protein